MEKVVYTISKTVLHDEDSPVLVAPLPYLCHWLFLQASILASQIKRVKPWSLFFFTFYSLFLPSFLLSTHLSILHLSFHHLSFSVLHLPTSSISANASPIANYSNTSNPAPQDTWAFLHIFLSYHFWWYNETICSCKNITSPLSSG